MLPKYDMRVVYFAIAVTLMAGMGVGKATGDGNPHPAACPAECNLRQGFCTPEGQCSCYRGWQGPNCGQCRVSVGCIHGTCNQPGQCNCMEGYGGRHCQLDLRYCERHSPCHNGATCVNDGTGSYECVCSPGFTGKTCASPIQPVIPLVVPARPVSGRTCLNGGTCVFGNAKIGCEKCSCPRGFVGPRCGERVRMCVTRPCSNGGACVDLSGGEYMCKCSSSFRGKHCMEDINECTIFGDSICQNGGKCVNRKGSFRCDCSNGFEGSRCEKSSRRHSSVISTTTSSLPRTTTSPTKMPQRADKESLYDLIKNGANQRFPSVVDLKQVHEEVNPENKQSTHFKMTQLFQQVEIKSSNTDVSADETSDHQASVSIVQAVTFAFLGVAVVLFLGIGLFLWRHCNKCGGRRNPTSDSKQRNAELREDRNNRSSILVPENHNEKLLECSRVNDDYATKPGIVVRTIAPSSASTTVKSRPPVGCLYVALPQQENATPGRISTISETDSLYSSSNSTQPTNCRSSYRH